jgi:hypothetical protein
VREISSIGYMALAQFNTVVVSESSSDPRHAPRSLLARSAALRPLSHGAALLTALPFCRAAAAALLTTPWMVPTLQVVGGAILLVDHLSSVLVWAGTITCLLASTAYVCIRWLEEGDQLLAAPAAAPPATRPADDEPSAEDGGLRSSDLKPSAPTEATPLKGSLADAPAPSASSGGCALQ